MLLTHASKHLLLCAQCVGCSEGQRNFIQESLLDRLEQSIQGGEVGGGLNLITTFQGGHATYLRVLLDQALRTRCVALGYCTAGHPAEIVRKYLVS